MGIIVINPPHDMKFSIAIAIAQTLITITLIEHKHFMYWSIFVYWLRAHYVSSRKLVVMSLCFRQLTCKTFHSFYLYVHIDFYYCSSFFIIWFIFQPKASISLHWIVWTFDFFVTFSLWQNLQAFASYSILCVCLSLMAFLTWPVKVFIMGFVL